MKYVNLSATIGNLTGVISPTEYLKRLPALAPALPAGARAFATDEQHYDFYSSRCVKDLTIERMQFQDADGEVELEIGFRHNCWKHEEDLIISYLGVSAFTLRSSDGGANWKSLPPVILDEILPHQHGCSHEIGCLSSGSLTLVCRDLTATWVPTDCPDKPSTRQIVSGY